MISLSKESNGMKKKKVYLSAPISGRDMKCVKAVFSALECLYDKDHYEVVNPLNNGLPETEKWHTHMLADLLSLSECDMVVFAHDWFSSEGCKIEYLFARRMGLGLVIAPADMV